MGQLSTPPASRSGTDSPVSRRFGAALGTLCVIDTRPRNLTDAQRESLAAIGRQVVAQIELRRALQDMEAAALVRSRHEAELAEYRRELEQRLRDLAELSLRDGLTGLHNRGALTERLEQAIAQHRRQGVPIAVVMIDIDNFKQRNDEFGHPAGDRALQALATALQSATREEDVVARYGGEEFTVVLSDADLDGALLAAERMRLAVERINLPEGPLTASFGIATAQPGRDHTAALLAEADRALYAAKDAGRNCVRAAESSSTVS